MRREVNETSKLRPGQAERIAHLFKRGHSLDLVSELGLLNGWTRQDAKDVVTMMGWSLDWSGRLHVGHIKGGMPKPWPSVAHADSERLLNAGIDHENPAIRKVALTAERAVEKLRAALMWQEQSDAENVAAQAVQDVLGAFPGPRGYEKVFRVS
jgi:hypothetical protein